MRTNEGKLFFSPNRQMWRNIGAKKEEKKKQHYVCTVSVLQRPLPQTLRKWKAAWQGVMQIPGKSAAVYLSRPLTSKVFAKGPESPRHRGDIKRWQRWRPSTGPFSQRIMEPGNTETHGAFFRCARPLGLLPSVVSLNGPSAARFLKFDKVLFAFVCSEPHLPFSVFFFFSFLFSFLIICILYYPLSVGI